MTVRNCHELGALSMLGRAHAKLPCVAPAKLASAKHSLRSRWPHSRRSRAKVLGIFSNTPLRTHL